MHPKTITQAKNIEKLKAGDDGSLQLWSRSHTQHLPRHGHAAFVRGRRSPRRAGQGNGNGASAADGRGRRIRAAAFGDSVLFFAANFFLCSLVSLMELRKKCTVRTCDMIWCIVCLFCVYDPSLYHHSTLLLFCLLSYTHTRVLLWFIELMRMSSDITYVCVRIYIYIWVLYHFIVLVLKWSIIPPSHFSYIVILFLMLFLYTFSIGSIILKMIDLSLMYDLHVLCATLCRFFLLSKIMIDLNYLLFKFCIIYFNIS